ncbi:MAG TPA: GNAT family N-acetyltransferase [Pseudonocardiaceae bacterium]|jgi:RimJ/RimL family protein N-acetyltransferase
MTPPELASTRLRLLPLAVDDAELLLPVYADPGVTEYFEDRFTEIEGVRHAVKQRLSRDVPPGMGTWLIQLDDTIVGHAHLWTARHPAGIVEIGWTIGKAHWGKGIATEAARAVIEHGFRRLGLPAIFAIVHQDNAASMRVAEKLGFIQVGEQEHHNAPHRMLVLLPDQTGSLDHVELRVEDLAAAESSLGWLLSELGWVPDARWPDGLSWRFGPLSVVVRAIAENHFAEADGDEAKPAGVRHDVLALSVGDSTRVSELTTALAERGWQLIAIDHAADGDGRSRQVAQLETPEGVAIELVGAAGPEEILEGFGPGSA